jgi:hypothetical protein
MNKKVTFAQLRKLLETMGFHGTTHPTHLAFEHSPSNTVFLFRTYRAADPVSPANLAAVRRMLDERGLMEADRFDKVWKKSPASGTSRPAKGSKPAGTG